MCHHELWPTSVSHPFSSLNSALGFAGRKHYKKITTLSLDLFLKILLFQVSFLVFFSIAIFSPYFLQVGLLLQCVALFQSGNKRLSKQSRCLWFAPFLVFTQPYATLPWRFLIWKDWWYTNLPSQFKILLFAAHRISIVNSGYRLNRINHNCLLPIWYDAMYQWSTVAVSMVQYSFYSLVAHMLFCILVVNSGCVQLQ